ncbi:MAG TPA: transcriptional regulator, partial [Chryseobacterium sp.]|nr:transcriptional regulator [Chryseobacterium sp.]
RINENYINIRFEEIISKMKKEILILDQLNEFRKSKDQEEFQKFEIYRSLLIKNIKNIEETLHKI